MIGNIIGVGIFTTPGEIASGFSSSGWVLIAWIAGGLMAMAGALTYAELGSMYPEAGGNYVFLREAYGPLVAFLYGWAYTLATSSGTIGLLALGFSEYVGLLKGSFPSRLFSVVVIMSLATLNARGVKLGAVVMSTITIAKIGAMAALVGFGFFLGRGNIAHFSPLLAGSPASAGLLILSALVPLAFTYSGWNSTVFIGEEVKNPEKTIAASMILGTLGTTLLYVLMNAVYLYAIPLETLKGSTTAASLSAVALFGPLGGRFIQVLVATSVLGCLSATFLTNTRTPFAMGRDGLFFSFAGKVHDRYHTPAGAIYFEAVWASVLVVSLGDFEKLLWFVSLPLVVIGAMTVISLFVFRFKKPETPRPYRCWGYPIVPGLYVIVSILMVLATARSKGWYGPAGLGLFALGVPVYFAWQRFKKNTNSKLSSESRSTV